MPDPEASSHAARLLLIGEVADRVGLSLRTVRYYEQQGLLTPHARSAGGFRLFTEDQVDRLSLIKQMKPLGFTVHEMRELLDARDALKDAARGAGAADGKGDTATRAAAGPTLAAYADSAADRIEKLRRQLAQAEGLADLLRREAGRG